MTDTDYKEDDILKRMLKTPPKKNEPNSKRKPGSSKPDPDRSRKKPD